MDAYTPPPAELTFVFSPPLAFGAASYPAITLRCPSGADILKATALRGESSLAQTLRLAEAVSNEAVPFDALLLAPAWQIDQMARYFDSFNGAPMPGPFAVWLSPPASEPAPASDSPPTA
jgi:hypothetical protein